tara:strand:+ start:1036 stop:1290 length:255 start_codon:yes stop_codon:yes gene_type:complete
MPIGSKFSYTYKAPYTEEDGSKETVVATVIGKVTRSNNGFVEWERVECKDIVDAPSWGFDISGGRFRPVMRMMERVLPNFNIIA